MSSIVGRHYLGDKFQLTSSVTPSTMVNENTAMVIDANDNPDLNVVTASFSKYFNTISGVDFKTTALPSDYKDITRNYFLRQPNDGQSTMPTRVAGTNGSSSYWNFDGHNNALAPSPDFPAGSTRIGDSFSDGMTVSFWLKDMPILASGSRYDNTGSLGSDKQRATLFSMDNTSLEMTEDQRSVTFEVKGGALPSGWPNASNEASTWNRKVFLYNNIQADLTPLGTGYEEGLRTLPFFMLCYPWNTTDNHLAPFIHEDNPNSATNNAGYGTFTSAGGSFDDHDVTWDFNLLGEWGTGKGPESGSVLRAIYNSTAADPDIVDKELYFMVSCSSNLGNDWNAGVPGGAQQNNAGKIWLDISDPITSQSLDFLKQNAAGPAGVGNEGDTISFILNSGENRIAINRGGVDELVSGSFTSGSHLGTGSIEMKTPWANMTYVCEGIVSESVDVTLDVATLTSLNLTGNNGHGTGSATYVGGTSASISSSETHGTFVQMQAHSDSSYTRLTSGNYAYVQEPQVNNGPGFLVGMRMHSGLGALGTEAGRLNGSQPYTAESASISFWKSHIGKNLEVWTKASADSDLIYKGKHTILDVQPQQSSGSYGGGGGAAISRQINGFTSIRIGGEFDTQGILPYGQAPAGTGDLSTNRFHRQLFGTQEKLRLRVTSIEGFKHKVFKNGKLISEFTSERSYIPLSGSAFGGYPVPFAPDGQPGFEAATSNWTGSIGESGTGSGSKDRGDGQFIVGKSTGTTPKYWKGKIAHMAIYNEALDEASVKGNYFALKDRFEGK